MTIFHVMNSLIEQTDYVLSQAAKVGEAENIV